MSKSEPVETSIIESLEQCLKAEHIGCDRNTCAIDQAYRNGFKLYAIKLFAGSGAGSEQFARLYSKLPKNFISLARAQCSQFVKAVDHVSCPHCSAVLWEPSESNYFCDNCGQKAVCTFQLDRVEPAELDGESGKPVNGMRVVNVQVREDFTIVEVALDHLKDSLHVQFSDIAKSLDRRLYSSRILKQIS